MSTEHTPQDDSAHTAEIARLHEELRKVYGDSEYGGLVLAKLGDALCRAGRLQEAIGRYEAAEVHMNRSKQETCRDEVLQKIRETRELLRQQQSASAQTPVEADDAGDKGARQLKPEEQAELLATLKARLEQKPDHYIRSEGIIFADVQRALEANPTAMWSIAKMEETGGSPDVVAVKADAFIFADCSAESPTGRRNCVYDEEAEEHIIVGFNSNAVQMAERFGVDLWSEDFYRKRQMIGAFDIHSWNWLQTPAEIRKSGRALSGNRFGLGVHVSQDSVHDHNDRTGWRGLLRVQKA